MFPDAKGAIGGAETRAILMARAISRTNESSVVVVVRDSQNRPITMVDGFKVVTWVDRLFRVRRDVSEHVSLLPFFPWLSIRSWVFRLIWQIPLLSIARLFRKSDIAREEFHELLAEVNCDVYCCLGVSQRTARIFSVARHQGRRTILFIAANSDLDPLYVTRPGIRNATGDNGESCAAAIRDADLIVCQTEVQQRLLKGNFGRESCLLPNPFEYDNWQRKMQSLAPPATLRTDRYALWVGRSDQHHKRPQILLSIAQRCPGISFVMIMNTLDVSVAAQMRNNCPENVEIIESVAFSEMPAWFRGAAMFISTGSRQFEGFPNVFLQAAASAVPIVSLEVDPGFVSEFKAGVVCNSDLERMMNEITSLWNNVERATSLGKNGQTYMKERHVDVDSVHRLQEIIRSVLR